MKICYFVWRNVGQADRMRVFGNEMPNIIAAIEREKGFHKKPIGPFGLYF